MNYRQLLLLGACLQFATQVWADDFLFERADTAAQQGDIALMQQTYESILSDEPTNVRAWNGKATALAWRGNYFASQNTYQHALDIEPDNLDSLTGIGYAYAWSGDYQNAHSSFARALTISPRHRDALKGDAYTYLWSGEYARAKPMFAALARDDQADAEVAVGLGQAHLQDGEITQAVTAFDHALSVEPGRADASAGRYAAYNATPRAETGLWYGSTSNSDSGLRQVDIAYWLRPGTRLSARYDDSLSLDNPALARLGESAETYFVGVRQKFNDSWSGNFELGQRYLPDGDQDIYRTELMWNGPSGHVTLGGQFGNHELGYEDTLYYVGFGVPIRDSWRVELNTYMSTTGPDSNDEWRSVLNLEYNAAAGWSVLVGGGYGELDAPTAGDSSSVNVAHATVSIPFMGFHKLHLSYRHESAPSGDFDVAMLGFTLRLPRN